MSTSRVGTLGLLVALVWALVAGGPVHAAAPSGGITNPTNEAVVTTSTPTITGSYSQPGGGRVDEVAVVVQSAEGHGSWSKVFPGNGSNTLPFSFQLPDLPYNGRYRAQAQAKGTDAIETNGQESSGISVRDFGVAVPPAAPTGLRATSSAAKQQVSLTWNANREPDMLGYEVQRQSAGSSSWSAVAQTPSTSAVDPVPSSGTWKYRVIAIRSGATSSEGVTSDPSSTTTTTVDPPPTTTTAPPPPQGGGSTGGGSGGDGGGGQQGSGATAGSGSTAQPGGATTSGNRNIARAGRVDLSGYAALLESNRRQLHTTPTTELDPGYDETLPFQPAADEPALEDPEGGQSVELGFTRTSVTDEAAQRRKWAYFAGSLLAFVLAMHGWFLRGEIRRQEELEALEPAPDEAASTRTERRARRAEIRQRTQPPPAQSDGATVGSPTDDKGGPGAGRAARRLSPRPGDDRPEGVAAVRARGRRAGRGDRRPAV